MNCIICAEKMNYYFSKKYTEKPFCDWLKEKIDYYRCDNCGFVHSQSHQQMPTEKWQQLNHNFHKLIEEDNSLNTWGNQPPYYAQAITIAMLNKFGLIDASNSVDYASGIGRLGTILNDLFSLRLRSFDPFFGETTPVFLENEKFKLVVNSAMFEHVLSREDLEGPYEILSNSGCLMIHTLVCETVPLDPHWFYLRPPVHTAFHTNKSMNILMHQWGFKSSIYSPQAKSWILFKDDAAMINKSIDMANQYIGCNWFICRDGFVDYWKGF